jgi:hypothetical protein
MSLSAIPSLSSIFKWFTTSNLLLLALTIVLSFFLMVLLIPPPKAAYQHSIAYGHVNSLKKQLAVIDLEFDKTIEPDQRVSAFNEWLTGRTPAHKELAKKLGNSPEPDPWENPYRFVRLEKEPSELIGVFSLGRDAKTTSNGNDTDDLNSWDENSGAIYAQEVFAAAMTQIFWPTTIMTPLLFVVLRRSFRHLGLMKNPDSFSAT